MKISSLFKGRAYIVAAEDRPQEDARFMAAIFKKIDLNILPHEVKLITSHDNYDDYQLKDDKGRRLKIKISFEKDEPFLKRESSNLKIARSPVCGYWLEAGNIKLGDEFSYLLYGFPRSESVREIGRSLLITEAHTLFDCYARFQQTKPLKRHYKTIVKEVTEKFNLKKVLSPEEKERVGDYTNYKSLESLVLAFKNDALNLFPNTEPSQRTKCHGALSLDSVFFNGRDFCFDHLCNNSMGHPFVDFIDLILESGLTREHEKDLLPLFCDYINIQFDKRLYHAFYECLLRKKLVELMGAYIYEVYLFKSYRIAKILNIADTFSQCYERFRVIPLFEENRQFILKTLTEPVLGVKA
jgi:hypothetical protein